MILLKHKPLILNHFEPYSYYDIGNLDRIKHVLTYTNAMHKFGTGSMSHLGNINVPCSLNFNKEFSISCWMYLDFDDAYSKSRYQVEYNGTYSDNIFYAWLYTNPNTIQNGYQQSFYYFGMGYPYYDVYTNTRKCNVIQMINYIQIGKGLVKQDFDYSDRGKTETIVPNKAWTHFEIDRDANNKLYFFINGNLINMYSKTTTFFKDIQNGYSGEFNCMIGYRYFDELLITQHCLHTSNFTPPTSPYWWSNGNKIYDEKSDQYTMAKGSDEIAMI